MSYYDKYIKYKMKYLSLKGGSDGKYRLPCEIIEDVNILYTTSKIKNKIMDLHIMKYDNIINDILIGQFNQDPVIILKDDINKNHGIIIKKDEISYDKILYDPEISNTNKYFNIIEIGVDHDNGNNYGGNFISAPNGSVFCFSGLDEKLYTYLNENLIRGVVQLNCSFRFNGERHIDECMCFMPYGNLFKIWIYKIRDIYYGNSIHCDIQKINKQLNDQGINISVFNEDQKNKIYILLCSTKSEINNIYKYQELTAGLDDNIKKIFTPNIILEIKKNLLINSSEIKKILTSPSINVEEIKSLLERERQTNLELISQVVFSKSYIEMKERFVEFPIDLNINDNNYRIINIPIFNRVCIKKNNKFTFLFSTNGELDSEVEIIFNKEIKEMNPDNNYHFINIYEYYNSKSMVGGGLHCLIKNGY